MIEKKTRVIIAQGAAMKEVIVCAMNLANAVFTKNSQKIMRKETKNFEAELQVFKQQVTNKLRLDLTDSELIKLASEMTRQLISKGISTLKH